MHYQPADDRYEKMEYRRCGHSGLKLPVVSLGLWQNFGKTNNFEICRNIIHTAFDEGITHFDLANNYGPPPGAAEEIFGNIFREDLKAFRDEIIISSKAGWKMWDGPYGDWGSRKYLTASLDQSLSRLGIHYVDIFYHHRYDPETPLEETMMTLNQLVRSGKALYAGISNYPAAVAEEAIAMLRSLGTPCLVHQPKYSLLHRDIEQALLPLLSREHVGCVTYSSLAQGLLTDKYLETIPPESRIGKQLENGAIRENALTPVLLHKLKNLQQLATNRHQSLAQMAISWVLQHEQITSVILGASRPEQVIEICKVIHDQKFSEEEQSIIDAILKAD